MRVLIGAVVLMTLTGCAYTLESVTQEKPEFVAHTDKTPSAYAECLKNSWLEYGPTFVKPVASGQRIFTQYSGAVGNAVDALDSSGKTEVRFYNPNALTPDKFAAAAKGCL